MEPAFPDEAAELAPFQIQPAMGRWTSQLFISARWMIPDHIRRFVLTSIPSVPYMEAVLLFHRMPELERTARDIARMLYIPQARAEELLDAMETAGVLACSGVAERSYRFATNEPALLEAIEGLAIAYRDDMVAITNLIHASAPRNAQRFADAFKFRRDK